MAFAPADWSYNTNIYEVNIRQYTKEGNFEAFGEHLGRLKDMGVHILWFMPIMPISVRDRKGKLGSYYAVQDYCKINPEFGTLEDFKQLVQQAHDLEMKVIIDWVANHTGNDHPWLEEHPDFYHRDENGEVVKPNDWTDVSHLSYDEEGTRVAMIESMKYWVRVCDIDGFRCDMAHLVPLDFWFRARTEIQELKSELFWLAECEEPIYHNAFDASYTWEWMHATEKLYKHETSLSELPAILDNNATRFHPDALRVYFTTNHDENSWNGTEYEKFRELAIPLAVFSCTWNGIPMIYSGQELPNYKRLKFFEKDLIQWQPEIKLHNFYKKLLLLKKNNNALVAGSKSSTEWIMPSSDRNPFLAYKRKHGADEVIVMLNLSADKVRVETASKGNYVELFSNEVFRLDGTEVFALDSYGYKVLVKSNK
jgi:alpha-amylase